MLITKVGTDRAELIIIACLNVQHQSSLRSKMNPNINSKQATN